VLGQVVFEVNQNMVLRAYVNAAGKVIAQQSRDGQFYWLHTNHLGSGTKITDSAGVVKTRSEFDPYGQPLLEWSSSGDTYLNTKKFTGYERDEATGLDYANARMYANGRGRFMQPDPKGLIRDKMNLPQSLNRYAYAGNDPINHLDPSGKDWFSFLNFFAQSECAFKGGDFGGFYFNDFGQLFISCRGRGGAVQQLTKQILEALGEWSPPTHKLAKITWSYTDIYSTRNGVTICGQEASFQVRVQGQLVKSQGRENSNVESISSDDPIVRSILGQSINRNSPQWGPESDLFYDYQGFRLIQSDIETLRKRLSSGQEVIVKAKTKIEITAPGNANAQFALEVSTEAWFKFDGDKPSCGAVVARPNNSGAKSFFFGND
jgi:RHS repeat-associated protein